MTIYGEQLLAIKYCRISSDGQTGRTKISVCCHFYNFNVKNATDSFSGIISTKNRLIKKDCQQVYNSKTFIQPPQ